MAYQFGSCLPFLLVLMGLQACRGAAPVFVTPNAAGTTRVSVAENSPTGTSIIQLAATDADGDSLTFTVSPASFIVAVTEVQLAAGLDFETTSFYSVVVTVTDGTSTATTTLNVDVTDVVDELPVVAGALTATMAEEEPVGTTVPFTYTVNDADAGDRLTYTLSGVDAAKFHIDSATGAITVAARLNRESQATYSQLLLTVRDTATLSATASLTVTLTDVNDNPPVCSPGTLYATLPENSGTGVTVTTVACTDADAGANAAFTLTLAGAGTPAKFQLSGSALVTTATALDYETATSHVLTVTAVDPAFTTTVIINVQVQSVNEFPPVWGAITTPISAPESTSVGSVLTTLVATDNDAGPDGAISYSVVSITTDTAVAATGTFTVDSGTGALRTAMTLNAEAGYAYYDVVVRAQDGGSPPRSVATSLRVTLTDVNEFAPVFSQTAYAAVVSESSVTSAGASVIVLAASDSDATSTLTFTITSGDAGGYFRFSATTPGLLETAKALEPDAPTSDPSSFSLTVKVSDGGMPAKTGTAGVSVSLTPSNDFSPVFAAFSPSSPVTVLESVAIGTLVATAAATDSDFGSQGTVTFSITSGNTNADFTVDAVTGAVRTVKALDAETVTSYTLTVTASDGGAPPRQSTANLDVTVTNVNENAPACSSYVITALVSEAATIGDPVATLACADDDLGDSVTYSIISGNTGSSMAIGTTSGAITTATGLDYETTQKYTLEVRVVDSMTPALSSTVTVLVSVSPVNDNTPVFAPTAYTVILAEDSAIGSVVVTVTATDADKGALHGTLRYSLVAGDPQGRFAVDASSGQLTLAQALDREATATYTLTIRATDDAPGAPTARSALATVSVTVSDVNDNSPQFTPSSYAITVVESATVGTTVAQVTAVDDDTGANAALVYSVLSGTGAADFAFVGNQLTVAATLDAETQSSYDLVIQVSDSGTPALTSTGRLVVTVSGVNDFPPVFPSANVNITVAESQPVGSLLYNATASDADTGLQGQVTYSLTSGDPNATYYLDSRTGELTLMGLLDYDLGPQSYALTVTATDGGGLTGSFWLGVFLTDVNDNTPVFTRNVYNAAVDENVGAGTLVTSVLANDADSTSNGQVTYTAVAGDGLTVFQVNLNTGAVTTAAALDFESKTQYSLVVVAVDGGSPARTAATHVNISLNDLNDNAPAFQPPSFAINVLESAPTGTTVTTLTATDADSVANSNNVITYSLTSSLFAVNGTTGEVYTTGTLDRETTASHVLEVVAVDGGMTPNSGTVTLTVHLIDVNDNTPTVYGVPYVTSTSELTSPGMALLTLNASDPDALANGQLRFLIASGNTDSDLSLDVGTGTLLVAKALDRERTASYLLDVRVADSGTPALTATTTVTVLIADVNDNAPAFSQASYAFSVPENVAAGTAVGSLVASDPDAFLNAALVFSVVNFWQGNSSHLRLDGASGLLTTRQPLDKEVTSVYVLWCRVSDNGSPRLSSDVNVTVTVTDLNDHAPFFHATSYSGSVAEDVAVGTAILTATVTDLDAGTNGDVTLSIDVSTTAGALADTFLSINSSTGILSVKAALDRETHAAFNFTLVARDAGSPSLSSSVPVHVTVTDVNDNAPVFSPAFYNTEVAHAGQCQTSVTVVSATDADSGSNGRVLYYLLTSTYSYLYAINADSGLLTLAAVTSTGATHLLTVAARDNGSPASLSSAPNAVVRVDTFSPGDHVVTFTLGLSRASFLARQATFTSQLQAVVRAKYPSALVRVWCVEEREGTSTTPPDRPVKVHVYILRNDVTEAASATSQSKSILSTEDALACFTSNANGYPDTAITGTAWDPFYLSTVTPYKSTEPRFEQTAAGIATLTVLSLLLAAALALVVILIVRAVLARQASPSSVSAVKSFSDTSKAPSKNPMLISAKPLPNKAPPQEQFFWSANDWVPHTPPTPSLAPSSQVTPSQVRLSRADGSYLLDDSAFNARAMDPATGRPYEYNTITQQRRWADSSIPGVR